MSLVVLVFVQNDNEFNSTFQMYVYVYMSQLYTALAILSLWLIKLSELNLNAIAGYAKLTSYRC